MLSKGTIFQTSLNLGLRSLAVLSKLLLVIYLGKYFLLSDLGTYHLFAISAALFVFILGFEFQSFSSREYEKMEEEKIGFFFSNQLFFLILCYLPGLILVSGFFAMEFLSWDYIVFFISILFFDLIALHIGVLFAARKFSTWFNFFVFLRGGLWIYIFVGWNYFVSPLGLFDLFWFWLIGVASAMFLGLFVLNQKGLWSPTQFSPDWAWIRNGIRIAFPFYILVIFMRLIDYIDRYFIELFHGKTEVGVYSFFAGIANVPVSLISSAITIQFMPLFLGAYRENNGKLKEKLAKEYLGMVVGILLVVFVGVYFFLEPLLAFVGKDELVQKQGILWILLFAASFLTIGTFPQLILYSRRMDQTLLWTGFVGLVICIALNYFLVPVYGVLGAAYAALGTRGAIFFSRTYFSFFGSNSGKPEKSRT